MHGPSDATLEAACDHLRRCAIASIRYAGSPHGVEDARDLAEIASTLAWTQVFSRASTGAKLFRHDPPGSGR
ncbi:MAG TPA: hypothetical protein VM681_09295 [Candidatus Thermoplasmatota archaeon]|nr:hypothetical protein [Candidatus Thermoplasmatota archaeon]